METENIVNVFDALSNETRLLIFKTLVANHKNGLRPGELSKMLSISKPTLSFHLSLLTHVHLVFQTKKGREIILTPNCNLIVEVSEYLLENCSIKECSENENVGLV